MMLGRFRVLGRSGGGKTYQLKCFLSPRWSKRNVFLLMPQHDAAHLGRLKPCISSEMVSVFSGYSLELVFVVVLMSGIAFHRVTYFRRLNMSVLISQ